MRGIETGFVVPWPESLYFGVMDCREEEAIDVLHASMYVHLTRLIKKLVVRAMEGKTNEA